MAGQDVFGMPLLSNDEGKPCGYPNHDQTTY